MSVTVVRTKIGGRTVGLFQYNEPYYNQLMLDICVAKLAISIARKMNALIFLVPEDIVDVRPRLVSSQCLMVLHIYLLIIPFQILTFVGSLMSVAQ